MTEQEALHVLGQRRDWLTARIGAKESIGWDVEWDARERDALSFVLNLTSDLLAALDRELDESPSPSPVTA